MKKQITLPQMILLNVINFGLVCFWSFDGAAMPLLLTSKFGLTNTQIGAIIGIGKLMIGLSLFFGIYSDLTQAKWGKRRPLMLIGGIIAAPLIALIPHMPSVWILIILMTFIYFFIQFSAVPYFALVPEVTPNEKLGTVNAFFSAFGGIGTMVAYAVLLMVVYSVNKPLAFYILAAVHLAGTIVTVVSIKELPAPPPEKGSKLRLGWNFIKDIIAEMPSLKELTWFLVMNFFFWLALGAFISFFTKLTEYYINIPGTQGGLVLGIVVVISVILAVPVGMLGDKVSRKAILMLGLILIAVGLTTGYFIVGPTSSVSGLNLGMEKDVRAAAANYGIDVSQADFSMFLPKLLSPPRDINEDKMLDDKKSDALRWCLNGELAPEKCDTAIAAVMGDDNPALAATTAAVKAIRPRIDAETGKVLKIMLLVIGFTALGLTICFIITATVLPTLMNEDKMGLYMGLYSTITGLGQLISGVLAGFVIDRTLAASIPAFGYRWLFIQGAFFAVLAILALCKVTYIPKATDPTVTDLIKAGKKTLGVRRS
jgi:Na+/melibiose symporter-like transporter